MLTRTVSHLAVKSHRCVGFMCGVLTVALVCLPSDACRAQDQYRGLPAHGTWHPLHHNAPPGQAAAWLNAINNHDPAWLQPVRVELPTDGTVSVFSATEQPVAVLAPPAQFSASVGHVYRLRLADMPEFPGVEVFPTVEILDRMHPPADRIHDYPIPVVITEDDLRTALAGQLVTRVVYLEQPQLAVPHDPLRRDFQQSVSARDNALVEADRRGRPMMIVRIGGRTPIPNRTPASFYGTGGAVDAGGNVSTGSQAVTSREQDMTRRQTAMLPEGDVRTFRSATTRTSHRTP